MEPIVNQIHSLLLKTKKTVAAVESCTGGLLASYLTSLSGSSKYFILGVVTYSNKSKEAILGIPGQIIAKNGAVSKPVAELMAKRARIISKTDFGIGITGIAGPTGGSSAKPVGTVYIGIDSKNKKICKELHFSGNRAVIRKKAALKSLELLKELL